MFADELDESVAVSHEKKKRGVGTPGEPRPFVFVAGLHTDTYKHLDYPNINTVVSEEISIIGYHIPYRHIFFQLEGWGAKAKIRKK